MSPGKCKVASTTPSMKQLPQNPLPPVPPPNKKEKAKGK